MGLDNSLIFPLESDNTIEVSLIGTGGGYGESVVVHLGENNWIVVDSCIDPLSKVSLPLQYLKSMGVRLSTDVKTIICSHWHDDHILGISQLLENCSNADFCMAKTTDIKKFLLLVGLDYNKAKSESSASSTIELSRCFEILKKRRPKSNIITAIQDRPIFRYQSEKIKAQVISLSPSDYVVDEFNSEISTLISEYHTSNRKIVFQSPNDKSIALYLEINNKAIILGSDLVVSDDSRKGWLCILDRNQSINLKSSVFKIPHHGSNNGYHQRIWDELLNKNPIAKLTPWNKGKKLPTDEMLKIYSSLTTELYTTSDKVNSSPKKREVSISKTIKRYNNTLREVKFYFGLVQSRLNLFQDNSEWEVKCFDQAVKIDQNS